MTKYILPIFIIAIVLIGIVRRVNVYDSFVGGTKDAMRLMVSIAPYIITILVLVEVFEASGLNKWLEGALSPIFVALGIPPELAGLVIIRPLSGSGSVAILENIIATYGVDSYIARCGAIIVGASETVFYVSVVYFSTTRVKKLRATLPIALFATLVGVVMSCLLARLM